MRTSWIRRRRPRADRMLAKARAAWEPLRPVDVLPPPVAAAFAAVCQHVALFVAHQRMAENPPLFSGDSAQRYHHATEAASHKAHFETQLGKLKALSVAAGVTQCRPPLLSPPVIDQLVAMFGHAARHASSLRLGGVGLDRDRAETERVGVEHSFQRVLCAGELSQRLCLELKSMCWSAAWSAANTFAGLLEDAAWNKEAFVNHARACEGRAEEKEALLLAVDLNQNSGGQVGGDHLTHVHTEPICVDAEEEERTGETAEEERERESGLSDDEEALRTEFAAVMTALHWRRVRAEEVQRERRSHLAAARAGLIGGLLHRYHEL